MAAATCTSERYDFLAANAASLDTDLVPANAAAERAAQLLCPIGHTPGDAETYMLLAELRDVLAECGTDGGQISPSIYDTAQALRSCPPTDPIPALRWLLESQAEDGGWGNANAPLARDTPTLAALLALHTYQDRLPAQCWQTARAAGLAFLRQQATQWQTPGDDIPVAVEMNLPRLLEEANEAGFAIALEPYAALIAQGQAQRARLRTLQGHITAGSPALYCWEAWGEAPDAGLLDQSGSVGHSPAATAAWLRQARQRADMTQACAHAEAYLQAASRATQTDIPGLLPVVWPVVRFEQAFALHSVLLSGLWTQPGLADVWQAQVADLSAAQRNDGWGMSNWFMADGDDTAAAIAVLLASGQSVEAGLLDRFARDDHFVAYAGEKQPSVSLTMRAAATLFLRGDDADRTQAWIHARQNTPGRWNGDKWNVSWTYNTLLALAMEAKGTHCAMQSQTWETLCAAQGADGGWEGSALDSSYGLLALNLLSRQGRDTQQTRDARSQAVAYLRQRIQPVSVIADAQTRQAAALAGTRCWLSKETYRMLRLDRVCELCALLSVLLEKQPLRLLAERPALATALPDPKSSRTRALRCIESAATDGQVTISSKSIPADSPHRSLNIALIAPLVTPIAEPFVGGAQIVLHDLALGLAQRGHRVTLFAAAGSRLQTEPLNAQTRANLCLEEIAVQPGELTPANFCLPESERESPQAAQRQEELFRAIYARIAASPQRFDIVHNHAYDQAAFRHAQSAAMPVVHTLHLPALDSRIQALLQEQEARDGCHAATTVSHACARTYAPSITCSHIIPNAIPLEQIPFGANPQGFLLFVGRITPEKRPDLAIAIARQAGKRLIMIGAIYDRAYYDTMIAPELTADPTIAHLGALPRTEVYGWMSRADGLLFTSEWEEPFGLVLAESLAAGTPVIAWERGASPEIVRQDETGFVLPFGDVAGAARAVDALPTVCRHACRREAEQRFSMTACLQAYESFFYDRLTEYQAAKPKSLPAAPTEIAERHQPNARQASGSHTANKRLTRVKAYSGRPGTGNALTLLTSR